MDQAQQEERRDNTSLDRPKDTRTQFERDLARLIHCAAFRRLQAKTQVLGIGEGDFHRTRLTHSMEVAQIGKGIVNNLKCRAHIQDDRNEYLPESDLISCICLAHDLGHPPFGHGGEVALNYSMRRFGGFEGNGQTLRILGHLEAHTKNHGLNLTRRSLLGILKYPAKYSDVRRKTLACEGDRIQIKDSDWKPPKCFHDEEVELVDWLLQPFSGEDIIKFRNFEPPTSNQNGRPTEKALDTTIMDLADDIAYGVHDLEDAIALKLIDRDVWAAAEAKFDEHWCQSLKLDKISKDLFENSASRKRAIGALVHAFISGAVIENRDFVDPLLKYRVGLEPEARSALEELKSVVFKNVISIPEVQTLEYRGQQIVIQLFDAICSDPPRLLKSSFLHVWEEAPTDAARMRVISDYISGMTDEYATRLYERLFMPRQGTVFQRL